jgi:tRNA nucleotidyltransferase/poly(A) polymerase
MINFYSVGGSVRDELMGLEPHDHDYVVVGATHDEMLSRGFRQVGHSFPVYLHPQTKEEYALARREKKVGVGHTGFELEFDPSVTIEDDLGRRDLTINAIARDFSGAYIDPYGGMSDLKKRVLRAVNLSAFQEDPLRVLRLARFAARFPFFTIDPETAEAAAEVVKRGDLNQLSWQREWAEMVKVFESVRMVGRFFKVLEAMGALNPAKSFMGRLLLDERSGWVNADLPIFLAVHSEALRGGDVPEELSHTIKRLARFSAEVESTYNPLIGIEETISLLTRVRCLRSVDEDVLVVLRARGRGDIAEWLEHASFTISRVSVPNREKPLTTPEFISELHRLRVEALRTS